MSDFRAEVFAWFAGAFGVLAWCFLATAQPAWALSTGLISLLAHALWWARGRGLI